MAICPKCEKQELKSGETLCPYCKNKRASFWVKVGQAVVTGIVFVAFTAVFKRPPKA